MIAPNICAKCPYAEKIKHPFFDSEGKRQSIWCVHCKMADDQYVNELFVDDEIPKDCPYILEHGMAMVNIDKEEMEYLKGCDE